MLEGARNRLAHLRGEIAIRIIWEAVILAALIRKLRLKKKVFAFNYARGDRSCHCSPDSFFEIVLTLIRRIESAETGGNRLQRQRLSTVLLPSGTVHYRWHRHAPEIRSFGSSHQSEYLEGTVGKQENWVASLQFAIDVAGGNSLAPPGLHRCCRDSSVQYARASAWRGTCGRA